MRPQSHAYIKAALCVPALMLSLMRRVLPNGHSSSIFGSKDELIEAVLERQHLMALERIRLWADQISGKPEQMVTALFEKLAQWAAEPEWKGSGFTRAAVELADLPGHPARKAARRHKEKVEM